MTREPWEPGPSIDPDGEMHGFSSRWFDRDGHELTNMHSIERLLQDHTYRVVRQERLWHGAFLSTVWLGLDHRFIAGGPPLIFETMLFAPGTSSEVDMRRYATLARAEAGHAALRRHWRWRPGPPWAETLRCLRHDTGDALRAAGRWLDEHVWHRRRHALTQELGLESTGERFARQMRPLAWRVNIWRRLGRWLTRWWAPGLVQPLTVLVTVRNVRDHPNYVTWLALGICVACWGLTLWMALNWRTFSRSRVHRVMTRLFG